MNSHTFTFSLFVVLGPVGSGPCLAQPSLSMPAQARIYPSTSLQSIGTISVSGGQNLYARFDLQSPFDCLDINHDFRWINVERHYDVGGVPQASDPCLGFLPAIDPKAGPPCTCGSACDGDPFYWHTTSQWPSMHAEGVSSHFIDAPLCGSQNCTITFWTYLVVSELGPRGSSIFTNGAVAGCFSWTYDSPTGNCTVGASVPSLSFGSVLADAFSNSAPHFSSWSITPYPTIFSFGVSGQELPTPRCGPLSFGVSRYGSRSLSPCSYTLSYSYGGNCSDPGAGWAGPFILLIGRCGGPISVGGCSGQCQFFVDLVSWLGAGPAYTTITVAIRADPVLLGQSFCVQGLCLDINRGCVYANGAYREETFM